MKRVILTIILTFSVCTVLVAQPAPPPTPPQEQPDVLTRGPVHEAYAEPVDTQPQQGVVATIQPPPNINETPPAEKPQGGNYVWVPGYWAWDTDRNNYIWVSGCWRQTPPNTYWIPGYWSPVSNGWEWVAGFWSPIANQGEIEYQPQPPALQAVEPPTPPSPDQIWVPPCWYWSGNQYVLRPGYWLPAQADWVWVPSHYIWTPRGYIFVPGHWDYSLQNRGVLFAPVYFPSTYYSRPDYYYSPSIVIDIENLSFSLFTYPRYCHYFFGDYYDDSYIRIGIFPWYQSRHYHTWYDPIYEHQRWRYHRTNPRWEDNIRHEYDVRRTDRNLRPAHTYREMETRISRLPEAQRRSYQIAQPLNTYVTNNTTNIKFEQINEQTRKTISTQETAVRNYRDNRSRWESPAPAKRTQKPAPQKQPAAAPAQPKQPAATTPQPTVTPPARQGQPTVTTPQPKPIPTPTPQQPSVTTPQRRETPPAQQAKPPVTAPAQKPAETKAPFFPPRQVPPKQPEKVKVPPSPIISKPAAGEKGPPPSPPSESKGRSETRSQPQQKNDGGGTKSEVKQSPGRGYGGSQGGGRGEERKRNGK